MARPANPTMRKILLAIIKVVLLKVFSLVFFLPMLPELYFKNVFLLPNKIFNRKFFLCKLVSIFSTGAGGELLRGGGNYAVNLKVLLA